MEKHSTAIIDEAKIHDILQQAADTETCTAFEVIEKARQLEGLHLEEAAVLLQNKAPEVQDSILAAARFVKENIYGRRLVLFAPLYVANHCISNCLYCGFRKDNRDLIRRTLTHDEIAEEVKTLEKQGHKRLLMLMGDHPQKSSFDYFLKALEVAYATKCERGEIRRINVEISPLSVCDFRRLKAAKIGTYLLFQETYHRQTYEKMHPSGPKANYDFRLTGMDRAQEAGIDDVGIGVLFGLYDYRFEVLALLQHADHMDRKFGVGPHTISVPRLEPAQNAAVSIQPPCPVSDADFMKLVAIIRLSVPYTGIILTTRELPAMRGALFELGVSQISAGSRTNPGGYARREEHAPSEEQFSLGDTRPPDEVIKDVVGHGCIPSFCTACYRLGRTGQDFMDLAKPGLIQKFCQPNALLTFKEYIEDYASRETKILGQALLLKEIEQVRDKSRKKAVLQRLKRIERGERDIYF